MRRGIGVAGCLLILVCWAAAAVSTHCVVCKQLIRERVYLFNNDYLPEKQSVCGDCAQLETTCSVCTIPIRGRHTKLNDGRLLCESDAKQCVLDNEVLQEIFVEVKRDVFKMFSGMGTLPDRNVAVQLATRTDLGRMIRRQRFPHDKHLTMGLTETRVKDGTEFDHRIHILTGLRRSRVAAIVAHEYAHTWLHENLTEGRQLDSDTVEGFCELVAYKLMTQRNDAVEKKIILENSYTSGQVHSLVKAEDRYRFYEVVQWIKSGKDERINKENTSRLLVRKHEEAVPVTWQPAKPTAVPDTLVLKGISGTPQRRFALVNDTTLAKDEQAKVRVGSSNVVVRCLDITANSVVLSINGSAEPTELSLGK
jgi:hypothetical protein